MNPIPVPRVQVYLTEDSPSKITPEELQKELSGIGLSCKLARIENLKCYIKDTLQMFPDGTVQGYKICRYNPVEISEFIQNGCTRKLLSEVITDEDIHANWKPTDTCPYMAQLAAVGFPEHFDYLKNNYKTFAGVKSSNTYKKNDTTVDAIKTQFVEIATNISSILINDMDKSLLEASLTKIIAPIDPGESDYDSGIQNRSIFLVNGYDPSTSTCESIGVLNVEYHLFIKNYKEKKSAHQTYHLDVTVRTSLYNDITQLMNEVMFIQAHLKGKMFFKGNIPFSTDIEIFESLPPANNNTFIKSLPLEQTENDIISVMVCYCPDLNNVGIIDNTGSDGSATYSKTITSGFSFTTGQKISAGAKYAAGALFTKAEFNVNLEISFTEQWNNSQSETITFSVPKGSKAYLYQGMLNCALLEYNIKTFTFEYKEMGVFQTNLIQTSPKPIGSAAPKFTAPVLTSDTPPLWQTINEL